ncbi:MAG TPA: hypothetical protein VJY62_19465 [Bacteroidia bacterium]|nr:hypothetical protein [Bacteroidia bacterium]
MKINRENTIEEKLLELGVVKLKRFGFIHVNADNIVQNEVYRDFFEKILKEEELKDTGCDDAISKLLKEIESLNPPKKNSGSEYF